ncbi:MAG: O-succinylhomoserine sulfhydrylase [Candidatus Thioglobus sp.]|jgi:O-succinylhomoserine sulfhydrylase|nr:O-succinylhomoserine sulfhydrylase [Candidatus Thioglobus sp.]|tara:strand:+ start:254 stop:1411 length:1158 start_codon:yes stop_codon:yes gene_type:complete
MKDNKFNTKAIREGYQATEQQEHSAAVFLTSSFTFDSAEQAARRFANEEEGNIYTRFTNPNVQAFEDRLAALEGTESCIATASGMSAIFATLMGLLKAGEHIVASRDMFGTTIVLLNTIVNKFNIEVTFVDLPDIDSWKNSVQTNTKIFLLETPSNPLGEVVDLSLLSALSKEHNILLAVDNCIMTPALQKPLNFGADLILHSATKYIDGQGRCLAGAVAGSKEHIDEIRSFCRATGPTLSAFNAWVILKGLETLSLRMKAHCENALKLAEWLQNQAFVQKVHYLGLESHPHHNIAKAQQSGYGGIVSFEVEGGKKEAFRIINNAKMISITANLGDTKSTITHPATTTHNRLTEDERRKSNISDNLVRISAGLEDITDIIADLKV